MDPFEPVDTERWIAGALMQTTACDGSGGTMVHAISYEDVRNPNVSVSVYDRGFGVR